MVRIDSARCTGCGTCVDVCPRQAISIDNDVAVLNEEACVNCGACATTCPTGAIHELAPVSTRLREGGDRMYYGYGRGFGFRGSSPPWPYLGRGRGGLPRCWHPGLWGAVPHPAAAPYWPAPSREEEMGVLKDQADVMKRELEDIERRIQELEKKQ
jgi:NAD-dependent dihydropyrimidine dehydrogenase PreA subunit